VHVTGGVVTAFPEVISLWPRSSAPRRLLWYRNVASAAQGDDPLAAWLLLQVEGETNPAKHRGGNLHVSSRRSRE
jgi:hypothetical protein